MTSIRFRSELFLLAALWGGAFLFLRISSPEFGPIPLIFLRTGIAALFLLPFIIVSDQLCILTKQWQPLVLIGFISTALPFTLLSFASLHLPVGTTSILNATTPIFSAITTYLWLAEKPNKHILAGVVIGFFGVYILIGEHVPTTNEDSPAIPLQTLPILAVLAAAGLYAVSSTYTKLKISHLEPMTIAAGSQLYAAIILLPFAIFLWPSDMPSLLSWISVLSMGIFSTALALVIFFRLIKAAGVNKTIVVAYLIPFFGTLWAYIFLEEQITLRTVFGGVVIFIGIGFSVGLFERALVPTSSSHSGLKTKPQ